MSRKSKRQSRKRSASTVDVTQGAAARTNDSDFSPDYSQTIKDLKRIGVLASTFFGVLIVLSFFLR